MAKEPEYIQLTSWEELVEFIELAQKRIFGEDWQKRTSPPKRKKKGPPQKEELW